MFSNSKTMTAKEVFELRKQERIEEAYEAARQLFAVDKSPQASSAMFWTAVDIRINGIVDNKFHCILIAFEECKFFLAWFWRAITNF